MTGLVRTSSTSEQLEGGARPDDVDDGVEGADLVEVDRVGRHAVEAALRLGECGEDGQGAGADPVGQVGAGQQAAEVGERAVVVRVLRRVDDGAGGARGRRAAPPRPGGPSPETGRRAITSRTSSTSAPASSRAPSAMSPAMPEKQWNQASATRRRPQARPARWLQTRVTAQAAPKPLSMPTTATPCAQELSMARRAVTPPKAAP